MLPSALPTRLAICLRVVVADFVPVVVVVAVVVVVVVVVVAAAAAVLLLLLFHFIVTDWFLWLVVHGSSMLNSKFDLDLGPWSMPYSK